MSVTYRSFVEKRGDNRLCLPRVCPLSYPFPPAAVEVMSLNYLKQSSKLSKREKGTGEEGCSREAALALVRYARKSSEALGRSAKAADCGRWQSPERSTLLLRGGRGDPWQTTRSAACRGPQPARSPQCQQGL